MEEQIDGVFAVTEGLAVQIHSCLTFRVRLVSRPWLMDSGVKVSGEKEGGAFYRLKGSRKNPSCNKCQQ
jgi:hypothetical protein